MADREHVRKMFSQPQKEKWKKTISEIRSTVRTDFQLKRVALHKKNYMF